VRLTTPDGQGRATLWVDEGYPYLMLFTGNSLPEPPVGGAAQGLS
jgi:hypothetical protein